MNSTAALAEVNASLATEPPANLCPLSFPHPAHDACDGKPQAPAFGTCLVRPIEGELLIPVTWVRVHQGPIQRTDLLRYILGSPERRIGFRHGLIEKVEGAVQYRAEDLEGVWEVYRDPSRHSTLEGDGTAPAKPVTVTDAPAVTVSVSLDRADIIALLQCMREFAPHGVPFKAGYRNAISILCSCIEQQLTDDQLSQAGEDPADLTLGAHLAATRRHFQILA